MIYVHEEKFESTTRFNRIHLKKSDWGEYTHWHEHYEIVIIEKGTIKFSIENIPEPIILSPGDVIFLLPNVLHTPLSLPDTKNSLQVLDFKSAFLTDSDAFAPFLNLQAGPHYSVYTAHLDEDIKNAFITIGNMFTPFPHKNEAKRLMLHGHITTVLGYLREHGSPIASTMRNSEDAEHHVRIKTVCSYIGTHLTEDLSIETLAKVAGYSPSHLYRLFKINVGCTIKEYIDNLKINEVQRMIRAGKTSISEISDLLGFSHPNNLGRMYKRVTGKYLSEEIQAAQIRYSLPE